MCCLEEGENTGVGGWAEMGPVHISAPHLLVVWPWASVFASLKCTLFICELGSPVSTSQDGYKASRGTVAGAYINAQGNWDELSPSLCTFPSLCVLCMTPPFRTPSLQHFPCCSQTVQASARPQGTRNWGRELPTFTPKAPRIYLCLLSRSLPFLPHPHLHRPKRTYQSTTQAGSLWNSWGKKTPPWCREHSQGLGAPHPWPACSLERGSPIFPAGRPAGSHITT